MIYVDECFLLFFFINLSLKLSIFLHQTLEKELELIAVREQCMLDKLDRYRAAYGLVASTWQHLHCFLTFIKKLVTRPSAYYMFCFVTEVTHQCQDRFRSRELGLSSPNQLV